jgi:hypothetical protein
MNQENRGESQQAMAALLVVCGLLGTSLGFGVVRQWAVIAPIYAAIGVFWCIAGASAFFAGLLSLLSARRRRTLLAGGGLAAALSGAALAGGLLANIIPCSGAG